MNGFSDSLSPQRDLVVLVQDTKCKGVYRQSVKIEMPLPGVNLDSKLVKFSDSYFLGFV